MPEGEVQLFGFAKAGAEGEEGFRGWMRGSEGEGEVLGRRRKLLLSTKTEKEQEKKRMCRT